MSKIRLLQCYFDFERNFKLSLSRFKTEKKGRDKKSFKPHLKLK